jgi:hypothetical protein
VRAKEYDVLFHAVEQGVTSGVRRAYKHSDKEWPTDSQIAAIADGVMNSICEWFVFDDTPTEN